MSGNTFGNGGDTRGNDDNTRSKLCQLKLNGMNCHVNCHFRFDAQVEIPSTIDIKIKL